MAKVLVTEQKLVDIANALRSKLGLKDSMDLSEIAGQIALMPVSSESYTVTLNDPGKGQKFIVLCDGVQKSTTFIAGKGSVISAGLRADSGYNIGSITATGGKQFKDGTYSLISNMAFSASAASQLLGGTKLGEAKVNASADGVLQGWTLLKIPKCIPNNSDVHFTATLYCPGDCVINFANSSMAISSFADGRAWNTTNKIADVEHPTTVSDPLSTTYTLEWDEHVNLATADFDSGDDDQAKNLIGYYCCADIKLAHSSGGTTPFTDCVLTVAIYQK